MMTYSNAVVIKTPRCMKRIAIMLSVLMAIAPGTLQAQAISSSSQDKSVKRTGPPSQWPLDKLELTKQLSFKVAEVERITLRNRFGPIVVTGVGGDTLDAKAVQIRPGTIPYEYGLVTSRALQNKTTISTAVMTREEKQQSEREKSKPGVTPCPNPPCGAQQRPSQPPKPQPQPQPGVAQGGRPARTPRTARPERPEGAAGPSYLRGVGEIRLEVRLPRNARIDLVDSRRYAIINTSDNPTYLTNTRNDVSVTNMETPINIISSGDVQVSNVGGLEVRTRAGSISVSGVSGPVHVSSGTGAILIKDVGGDVRAVSISGPISIECARGRIEANTANGIITLGGIGGDLEASTTGGAITFTGAIRENGRYRLRSMSGQVRMLIQAEPPGFQASASSYKGQVLVDFPLKSELSSAGAPPDLPPSKVESVRRLSGSFGDGGTRISLDSFSGTVQLGRAPSGAFKRCP